MEKARNSRSFHSTNRISATPLPNTVTGPAPPVPSPPTTSYDERVNRRLRQAEPLKHNGSHTVHLDARPLRTPSNDTLIIPPSKPQLASAIALEWSLLTSNTQALKQHLIPLTSSSGRALDLEEADKRDGIEGGGSRKRTDLVNMLMRYLDTDTLLCWAPEGQRTAVEEFTLRTTGKEMEKKDTSDSHPSLRQRQIQIALPIIGHLESVVFPGIRIQPVDSGSILPVAQSEETKAIIRGWISGLGSWDLAGLERTVLAGKSLLVGLRLIAEWSEQLAYPMRETKGNDAEARFGVAEACEACSVEVNWQTGMWGEVEDTHDVNKEDLRRQMGNAILLVAGAG
ncbi:ATP synthase complex assembly protein atp12 [Agyrium rufum]|nr:ATP synthase complex assembly protein atp12 [Agyrium rufum]